MKNGHPMYKDWDNPLGLFGLNKAAPVNVKEFIGCSNSEGLS